MGYSFSHTFLPLAEILSPVGRLNEVKSIGSNGVKPIGLSEMSRGVDGRTPPSGLPSGDARLGEIRRRVRVRGTKQNARNRKWIENAN